MSRWASLLLIYVAIYVIYCTPVPQWKPPYCPLPCLCIPRISPRSHLVLKTMLCANAGWTSFPANISLDTQVFILTSNRLPSRRLTVLTKLVNLTELDISDNRLYSLELRVTVPGLRYLVINRNELDYLANRTFIGTPNLLHLSLAKNRIEMIHKDAFCGLHQLKVIDMSENRIFEINPSYFRDLELLESLDLHGNNIHVLADPLFWRLKHLRRLNLGYNRIKHLYWDVFHGLERLEHLELNNNHLRDIPSQTFQNLADIWTIDLSGNHFVRFESGKSFENTNVSVVRLNRMDSLELVDSGAFINLPLLTRLELFENKKLKYIDRNAFLGLPKLHSLLLHQNNLSTLELDVIRNLPSLATITFYDNPITCDCSLRWLAVELNSHNSSISIVHADRVLCTAPAAAKGMMVNDSKLRLPSFCAPRIIPSFQQNYETYLGDQVRLDCRAVGNPPPQTNWLLPSHFAKENKKDGVMALKSGGNRNKLDHVSVSDKGTLSLDYIEANDGGQYRCLASNSYGRDERVAQLVVKNMGANVIITRVTIRSITVTWKSTRHARDYQIVYRRQNSNETYHVIEIKSYMRSYTVNSLSPKTLYEFCIAFRHGGSFIRINCTTVHTRTQEYLHLGLFNVRNYILGGTLGCMVMVLLITCLATYVARRYNRKKRQQQELYSNDNLSQMFLASIDSMSDTTPITYENRVAEMFDDDDIAEIRSTASMPKRNSNTTFNCEI